MSRDDELFEEFFDMLTSEYDRTRDRVDQEEVSRAKKAPQGDSLVVSDRARGLVPGARVTAVEAPIRGRKAKKEAEEETMRLWRIWLSFRRTALANESIGAVSSHGFRAIDKTVSDIFDEFYFVKRHEASNRLMQRVAARCASCAEAGILAIMESHPKRVAEYL